MSRPQEMVEPLETLLEHIKEKLDSILSREPNSSIKEILRDTSRERVGVKHEDITDVYPCYVPLVILGSKYDLFQVREPFETEVRNSKRDRIWMLR